MSASPSKTGVTAAPDPTSPHDRLRDSSAALLAQADGLRQHSAALMSQLARWSRRAPFWGGPSAGDIGHSISPESAATSSQFRLVALDAARVVATFGVMWTHVAELQGCGPAWAALGRFGTSFYILAAVYLATRSAIKRPAEPLASSTRQRAKRLLRPFLLWSAIYGAFYGIRALQSWPGLVELTMWWGPFAGTARHLWFLPFAFASGVLAAWLTPRVMMLPTTRLIGVGAIAVAIGYWFCYRVLFFALDRHWAIGWHLHRMDRWIEEIPLVLLAIFGTALYVRRTSGHPAAKNQVDGQPSHRPGALASRPTNPLAAPSSIPGGHSAAALSRVPVSLPTALLLGLAFLCLELLYLGGQGALKEATGSEGRFVAHAAGLSLLGAFLAAGPRHFMVALAPLGRVTYFAFLAHILLLDLLNPWCKMLPGYGGLGCALVSSLALFAVSVAIGAAARRAHALRWLIP